MNRFPMFSPQLLISFVAVCETSSFTRAADRVSLSQSTVSQQVRRLAERPANVMFFLRGLFGRSGKPAA